MNVDVNKYLKNYQSNGVDYKVHTELTTARDLLFKLIHSAFPDYLYNVTTVEYENPESKESVGIQTEVDIKDDTAHTRFIITMAIPLIHSGNDSSPALSEEKFWELLNRVYSIGNFGRFTFESIQNASVEQHMMGQGFVYAFTLVGEIPLKEKIC